MRSFQPVLLRPFVVRLHLEKKKKNMAEFDRSRDKKLTSERSVDVLDLEVLTSFDGV